MNCSRRFDHNPKQRITRRCGRAIILCGSAAMLVALHLGGCKSTDESGNPGRRPERLNGSRATPGEAPILSEVERSHVIGPSAARELDYRVAWQHVGAGPSHKLFTVEGDSVFVLDAQNYLSRIKVVDGGRLWRMQVTEPIDLVVGLNFTGERVYVTTSGAVLALDPATGSQIDKQPLRHIANTQPTMLGDYLIYGSRSGLVVWHSGVIGYQWRGYKVSHAINVPPIVWDNYIVATGSAGEVVTLHATDARQLWSKRLLAPVVAAPAVGDNSVFVAGTDQFLAAYEIGSGRNLWRVLTESQLVDSPTLVGDRLYQRIPRRGLFCYAAQPPDTPGGQLIWKSPDVDGNVVLQRRNELFVWNKDSKQLIVVDAARGSLVKTLSWPSVRQLVIAGEKGNEFYAVSDDGRVVRVVPRN